MLSRLAITLTQLKVRNYVLCIVQENQPKQFIRI